MTDAASSPSSARPPRRPPWQRPELPGSFTVEETATRIGHYLWLERRLFELLGGWVAFVPFPDARTLLGRQCFHHSFHAELWYRRLPELGELTEERLVVSPGPEVEGFVDAFAGVDPTALFEESGGRPDPAELQVAALDWLIGHTRVLLPQLLAAYTFHRNNVATVTDAPTMRILDLCLADVADDWREAELVLQGLLIEPSDIQRAATRTANLTTLLVEAGGVVGADSVR
ncbi:MAG: hypothetical protein ACRBI6_13635 [Acidimicrobiales bacterium]